MQMTHVLESHLKLVVDSLAAFMLHNTQLCETTCYPQGNNYRNFIVDYMIVKGQSVLRQGLNKNSVFGSNAFQGDLIAIKLNFK